MYQHDVDGPFAGQMAGKLTERPAKIGPDALRSGLNYFGCVCLNADGPLLVGKAPGSAHSISPR